MKKLFICIIALVLFIFPKTVFADTQYRFNKIDDEAKHVPNTKLKITGKDDSDATIIFTDSSISVGTSGSVESTGESIIWTTGSTSTIFVNIPDGTYTVEEIEPADGYVRITTPVTFRIKDEKVINCVGLICEDETISLLNEKEGSTTDPSQQTPAQSNVNTNTGSSSSEANVKNPKTLDSNNTLLIVTGLICLLGICTLGYKFVKENK